MAVTFTNDTAVGAGDTTYDGQDIVIDNCTVTIDGPHGFSNVKILTGGVLTHSMPPTSIGLDLTVTNDFEIQTGGAISVVALGNGAAVGGSITTNFPYYITAGAGGGHGGNGGASSTLALGGTGYDSAAAPGMTGSAGGASGGAGGGVVKLAVGGELRVDGVIESDGGDGMATGSGGGSGGSLYLTVAKLSGAGLLTSCGGDGDLPNGGGGGGGRIAVYFQTNEFTGSILAAGGRGAVGGGAGTILIGQDSTHAQMIIDNGGVAGADTLWSLFATLDLNIAGGARVVMSASPISVKNLNIGSNSWISAVPYPKIAHLTVNGDASIQAGGGVTVDSCGYPDKQGPGAGLSDTSRFGVIGSGGGHGGYGGADAGTALGGGCYGSVSAPITFGSAGGAGSGLAPYNLGGIGGGAVQLDVTGNLTMDGMITAKGGRGAGSGSGGGAGGSIWLNVGSIVKGTGVITAEGGSGDLPYGGGGGGGRITLLYGTNTFLGNLSACGGPGANSGGAGTIFSKQNGSLNSQILIDNRGAIATTNTLFTPPSGNFDLTLSGGATVTMSGSSTLSMGNLVINSNCFLVLSNSSYGTMLNASNVTIQGNSGLALDGAGYGPGLGTGHGSSSSTGGSGGGYGGPGGAAFSGGVAGGISYGGLLATSLGSGGGSYSPGLGGSGGGALNLSVSGRMVVDGRLSANGGSAFGTGGGGSGGSLWLRVGTLSGTGLISADGGAGDLSSSGGGGGGRITLNFATNTFAGTLSACGGPGANRGGAGIIYSTAFNSSFSQVTFNNGGQTGATNTFFSPPSERYDLTLSGGATVIMSGSSTLSMGNLVINSNCFLMLSNSSYGTMLTASNVTIQGNAGLVLDGGGYGPGQGAGHGSASPTGGSGGGYGGSGGAALSGGVAGGIGYGKLLTLDPGSGGGAYSPGLGGSGGGALQMYVAGQLVVDGKISANGGSASGTGGGGSGGGLWLKVGTLSGAGLFSADGGAGDLNSSGGGGGGRIALFFATNNFVGTLSACGGPGANRGGAGSIYSKTNGSYSSQLTFNNGGQVGATNTFFSSPGETCDLTLSGGASLLMGGSSYLYQVRNLAVNSNCWLNLSNAYSLTQLSVNDLTIQSNAGVVVDGCGYVGGQGTGHGNTILVKGIVCGSGGGYGGNGGSSYSATNGGASYGSISTGVSLGSGGGGSSSAAGAGGGTLQLVVMGKLALDGKISANGSPAKLTGGGGGSGGGVWLTVGTISGTGVISANGGDGDISYGGGGGGGRIAIFYRTNSFAGTFSASGGSGRNYGGAGSIYLKGNLGGNFPLVIIDNQGEPGSSLTPVALSEVCDLTLNGGARVSTFGNAVNLSLRNLTIQSNCWLNLSNSATLNISGNASIESHAGILLDGNGYRGLTGPGAGYYTPSQTGYSGTGGSYGGSGGIVLTNEVSGLPYGWISSSPQMGSGGGGTLSSSGGGALQITVTSNLFLNGVISAKGASGIEAGSGGGSGGGIWVTVGTLSGAGSIAVNGGAGDFPNGGGGGGGRIAIVYATNLFTGGLSASGGAGGAFGGAGTIYLKSVKSQIGSLIVDNAGQRGKNTPLPQLPTPCDLTISSGAVATSVGNGIHNLLISSNSAIIAVRGTPAGRLFVSGDATIQPGGAIHWDAVASAGIGRGIVSNSIFGYTGSGGGYGGLGGSSVDNAPGGNSYGSILQPLTAGSAGGGYQVFALGGGALEFDVIGKLVVDGTISANGADVGYEGGGGGSGGGILVNAGNLAGHGVITANGGAGDWGQGGGGGGGRIAIYYRTNAFAGTVQALGGAGAVGGGAGTVYSKANSDSSGSVLVDNEGWPGAQTPISAPEAFNLKISGGAEVIPDKVTSLVLRSLVIDSNSFFSCSGSQQNVDLTVLTDLVVATNASITADGKGFASNFGGPGSGGVVNGSGSGGGYGGKGGNSRSGVLGGLTYGSAAQPIDLGSRGGLPVTNAFNFSQGGGSLRLKVGRTLSLDGKLSANGSDAVMEGAGGGSGGSVWLTAQHLKGSGAISANGGAGEAARGGGGGGGRIALYFQDSNLAGSVLALGGKGAFAGQNGSVLTTNIPAPQIISQAPSDVVFSSVGYLDLTFGAPMDFSKASPSNILITTPTGELAQNEISLSTLNLNTLRISFPKQTTMGFYSVNVGTDLQDIYGVSMAAPYVAEFIIWPPSLSGTITDTNGAPVPYATVRLASDLTTITDAKGDYSVDVAVDWSGTVTPAKGNKVFIPTSRCYTNLDVNLTGQDFIAASSSSLGLSTKLDGQNLSFGLFGINGVTYQLMSSTNLVDWQPCMDPVRGTNGPVSLEVPQDGSEQQFFRFSASY